MCCDRRAGLRLYGEVGPLRMVLCEQADGLATYEVKAGCIRVPRQVERPGERAAECLTSMHDEPGPTPTAHTRSRASLSYVLRGVAPHAANSPKQTTQSTDLLRGSASLTLAQP